MTLGSRYERFACQLIDWVEREATWIRLQNREPTPSEAKLIFKIRMTAHALLNAADDLNRLQTGDLVPPEPIRDLADERATGNEIALDQTGRYSYTKKPPEGGER